MIQIDSKIIGHEVVKPGEAAAREMAMPSLFDLEDDRQEDAA